MLRFAAWTMAGLLAASTVLTVLSLAISGALPRDQQLAFVSERDGNAEIYLLDVNHKLLYNLTHHPANDYAPVWSPDGTQLAFTSTRDHDLELYLMNPNGNHLRRLTSNNVGDLYPVWSPDGRHIAFVSDRDREWWQPGGNWDRDIYLLDTTCAGTVEHCGSAALRLTTGANEEAMPAWSPDGMQIAFQSTRDGNLELYVMDAEGSHVRRLTVSNASNASPSWSPDGSQIAFASGRASNWDIFIVRVDGSSPHRLTDHPANDTSPAWRP